MQGDSLPIIYFADTGDTRTTTTAPHVCRGPPGLFLHHRLCSVTTVSIVDEIKVGCSAADSDDKLNTHVHYNDTLILFNSSICCFVCTHSRMQRTPQE